MRLRKSTKANNRLPKGGFHAKLWPTMEGYDGNSCQKNRKEPIIYALYTAGVAQW